MVGALGVELCGGRGWAVIGLSGLSFGFAAEPVAEDGGPVGVRVSELVIADHRQLALQLPGGEAEGEHDGPVFLRGRPINRAALHLARGAPTLRNDSD